MRRRAFPSSVVLAAGVTVLLWSSAFVAVRYAGRGLAPGALALGRLTVGSLALGVVMLVRREPPPQGRALVLAIASGVLWFGIYNVALNAAERRIDAGTAALLVNTGPLFLMVAAGLLLREGFPRGLLVGAVVSFAGVALIGIGASRHGVSATGGAALCLLAALVYALGVVAQKPALRESSALSITWTACTVAAVGCLPWAPELVHEAARARTSDLVWTGYLGLAPTAVGFGLWSYCLARSDAGRLGVTTYLVPPLSVLLGWVMLGEAPAWLAAPGGLLCLAGVAVARRRVDRGAEVGVGVAGVGAAGVEPRITRGSVGPAGRSTEPLSSAPETSA